MSNLYTLKESTLTALADIAKEQTIGTTEPPHLYVENLKLEAMDYTYYEIPGVKKLKVIITPVVFGNSFGQVTISLGLKQGKPTTYNEYDILIKGDDPNNLPYETIIEGSILGVCGVHTGKNNSITINIELFGLDENGNEYKYTPLEAIEIINDTIDTLKMNSVPTEALNITQTVNYKFAYGGWDWFIEVFGDRITTSNLSDAECMFLSSNLESIPFELNFYHSNVVNMSTDCNSLQGLFQNSKIKEIPKINGAKVSNINYTFSGCKYLRYIPDDFFDQFDYSFVPYHTSSYWGSNYGNTFTDCYSLRKLPESYLRRGYFAPNSAYPAYSAVNYCYVLDEIINYPVFDKYVMSYNQFSSFLQSCCRLKEFTFETKEDGTPYEAQWKTQTLDFTKNIGYVPGNNKTYILGYNSGITEAAQVTDDVTYQALKNDPDWWTLLMVYSRYNHDSAVNTINSLPDTSAYGTNTIKFYSVQGSSTDGGAIGNLTEEEIAVAAAKGWTVTLS